MLGLLVGYRSSALRSGRSHYIVGRGFDSAFFLLPPMLALGLGIAVSNTWFSTRTLMPFGEQLTGSPLTLQVLVHGHLLAVLLRSHGNAEVFELHPWRFLVMPPLLYTTLRLSEWALAIVSVLATFFWAMEGRRVVAALPLGRVRGGACIGADYYASGK